MDKYQDLTLDQLAAKFAEVKAERDALRAKTAATFADATKAEELTQDLIDIKAAGDKLRALQASDDLEFAPSEPEEEPEPEVTEEHAEKVATPDNVGVGQVADAEGQGVDLEAAEEEPVEAAPEAGEKVEAGAGGIKTLAAKRTTMTTEMPQYRQRGHLTLVASSGLDKFSAGERLDGTLGVAEAAIERVQSFPDWEMPKGRMRELGEAGKVQLHKFGTAQIDLGFPEDLIIDDRRMTAEQMDEVFARACDESTLPGGSLLAAQEMADKGLLSHSAAAGWCAPSETQYDIKHDATMEGLLSHPEVGIRRGGAKWPVSPQFSDFYANPGFKYTEAQVMSGVTKPCVTIDCPTFDEARLSVEGLCLKVDILTNVGYPEAVKNFTDGTMVAHAHWMNATKIGAMVTAAGTVKDFTGVTPDGSVVDDSLAAFEYAAESIRQKYRLGFNATMEAVVPHWVLGMWKADLRRRNGVLAQPVSDNDVKALLRGANINVQFVYDWQDLPLVDAGDGGPNEALTYPITYNVLLYPAGTFLFGTQPVINLSTVYDAASLAVNQYTGLFTEQGWLVAKRKLEAWNIKLKSAASQLVGARGPLDIS